MPELGTIAILSNQLAGRHQALVVAQRIMQVLDRKNWPYVLFKEQWPADMSGFWSVWIIGGDGTLNYFLNHATGNVPPLVIFKAGTGNDFAHQLYGHASVEEVVMQALNASPRSVDMGICNGRFFVNMAGIGFDGEVLKYMDTIRWLGSFWGYYAAILRVITRFREPVYNVSIDDGDIQTKKLLLLMVSNAPETGGGFRVSPQAKITDGLLNLVMVDKLNILQRILLLPRVRKGRHLDRSYVFHQSLRRILIRADREVRAQLDGEMISGRQFDIEICAAKFQFLY